jgi:phage terminase small subunit
VARKALNPHGLTDQQYKFCLNYLADPEKNASKAYRGAYPRAGVRAAETGSSRLLSNAKVQEFLDSQREQDSKAAGIDREYVLDKLRTMAELGLKTKKVKDSKGKVTHERFVDSYVGAKGVELLGKHLKMFTDKVEHSGEIRHTGVLRLGAEGISMEDWLKATGGITKKEAPK